MNFDNEFHNIGFHDYIGASMLGMGGGEGRIYVTSPQFGVDISVDYVRADIRNACEERDIFTDNHRVPFSFRTRQEFELRLTFSMPSLHVLVPYNKSYSGLKTLNPEGKIFLLDHTHQMPRLPIWLPPGLWKCQFCDVLQNEGLLQCRACGGTRFEADHDTYGERVS